MEKKLRLIKAVGSGLVIFFWFVVLLGILYAPTIINYFSREKTLNVLSWGGLFDTATLMQFTKDTGIKVNLSFYSTNEELLVYLRTTKGKGYDIVVPSDYAVSLLKKEGLIKKIDKSRLGFYHQLNPNLVGLNFDPDNDYSIPYMIEFFGLGYRKSFFGDNCILSWDSIFSPHGFNIVMVNDPIEAALLAANYIYGAPRGALTLDQINSVRQLLIKQRSWVEAYSDFRPDYFLLTHTCPLVVTAYSSYRRSLKHSSDIGFVIPEGKTFISIENISISSPTDREDDIYQFINYIYSKDVLKRHFENQASVPATSTMLTDLHLEPSIYEFLTQKRVSFIEQTLFFAPIMPERLLHSLWIEVKSQ